MYRVDTGELRFGFGFGLPGVCLERRWEMVRSAHRRSRLSSMLVLGVLAASWLDDYIVQVPRKKLLTTEQEYGLTIKVVASLVSFLVY